MAAPFQIVIDMPSRDDHLHDLERELDLLQETLATDKDRMRQLDQYCHDLTADFGSMNKKHNQLLQAFETYKFDLWCASNRIDRHAAERAEEKMKTVIEQQVGIQRRLPGMYRRLGEAVGGRDTIRETIREHKEKVTRKMEEIHTLKPCQNLICSHCGRGSPVAVLQKVKSRISIKNRVAKIWRAK